MTSNIKTGREETERLLGEASGVTEFELLGLEWTLLPGVFAPFHSPSTLNYSQWLPYPKDGSLLEMGCGAGVTAVYGALQGCRHVTAVDIVPVAVDNARRNAERHGVTDQVRVLESDMFGALGPDDRFDLIFWNSNAIEAPADFEYTEDLERSVLDRGYASHRAYLQEGPRYLADGGRLFIGFNSRGNLDHLQSIADQEGLRLEKVRSTSHEFPDQTVEFRLFEVVRSGV